MKDIKRIKKKKEEWEVDLDGLLFSYKVANYSTFYGIINRFIRNLLSQEKAKWIKSLKAYLNINGRWRRAEIIYGKKG